MRTSPAPRAGLRARKRRQVVMQPRWIFRGVPTLPFLLVFLAGLLGLVVAQAQAPHVLLLKVDGIINPVKERLIARTIRQAQEDQATLVIIELDTPGGLLSSTRKIVEELLESPVPIVVAMASLQSSLIGGSSTQLQLPSMHSNPSSGQSSSVAHSAQFGLSSLQSAQPNKPTLSTQAESQVVTQQKSSTSQTHSSTPPSSGSPHTASQPGSVWTSQQSEAGGGQLASPQPAPPGPHS